jgi:hypothetical protein
MGMGARLCEPQQGLPFCDVEGDENVHASENFPGDEPSPPRVMQDWIVAENWIDLFSAGAVIPQ